MGDTGLEQDSVNDSKSKAYAKHHTLSDVESDVSCDISPIMISDSTLSDDLREIAETWGRLSSDAKARFLAIVQKDTNSRVK